MLEAVALCLHQMDRATLTAERPFLTEAARPIVDLLDPIARSGGVPVAGILRLTDEGAGVEPIRGPVEALHWLGLEYIAIEV